MVTFMCTTVVPKSSAMVGRAVATTVESSICMNSAQPTMKGIIRISRDEAAGGTGMRCWDSGMDGRERGRVQ